LFLDLLCESAFPQTVVSWVPCLVAWAGLLLAWLAMRLAGWLRTGSQLFWILFKVFSLASCMLVVDQTSARFVCWLVGCLVACVLMLFGHVFACGMCVRSCTGAAAWLACLHRVASSVQHFFYVMVSQQKVLLALSYCPAGVVVACFMQLVGFLLDGLLC